MKNKIISYIFVFLNILLKIFYISIFTVMTILKYVNIWAVGIIYESGHEGVIHFTLTFVVEVVVHFAEIWLFNGETVVRIICTIIFKLNLFHLIIIFKFWFVYERWRSLISLIICNNIIFLKEFRTLSSRSWILLFADWSLSFQARVDWFARLIVLHCIANSLGLLCYILSHFYLILIL